MAYGTNSLSSPRSFFITLSSAGCATRRPVFPLSKFLSAVRALHRRLMATRSARHFSALRRASLHRASRPMAQTSMRLQRSSRKSVMFAPFKSMRYSPSYDFASISDASMSLYTSDLSPPSRKA